MLLDLRKIKATYGSFGSTKSTSTGYFHERNVDSVSTDGQEIP
jgi:hypothetical protein